MRTPFARAWFLLPLLAGAALAQDLPKREAGEQLDFEPKLMLNDLPDLPQPESAAPALSLTSEDIAKLEAELERAKKNAAWRARLCKAGVLSKVEAEQGALKVERVTLDLQKARLQLATQEIERQRQRAAAGELAAETLAAAEAALAAVAATVKVSTARWSAAQRAAAELRVQRERKLLASGAGSRSAVKRAEAALQSLTPATVQP